MIELDRRQLVAGIAVMAVAGVAPALPNRAASAALLTPRAFMLGAPWHFDHLSDGTLRISHVSGFSFYNDPRPDGRPVFACRLGEAPSTSPNFLAFERAATFIARHAHLLRIERQHSGAIYLDYTQRNPCDPFADVYTEDAPPHPDLARFYQIRFPFPDPRGGWFDT